MPESKPAYVTVARADLEAVLAGPGDGSWECADARGRLRSALADLDRVEATWCDDHDCHVSECRDQPHGNAKQDGAS